MKQSDCMLILAHTCIYIRDTCQYIPLHIPSVRIRTKTCYISYVIARILVRFNPVSEDVAYVWVCTVVCIGTYFFTDMYTYISIRTIHTCTCQYGLRLSSPRAAAGAPARRRLNQLLSCGTLTFGNSRPWLRRHVRAQGDR